jgi:hypothetical protein
MSKDREFCLDFIDVFFLEKKLYQTFVASKVLNTTKNSTAQLENQNLLKINYYSVRSF